MEKKARVKGNPSFAGLYLCQDENWAWILNKREFILKGFCATICAFEKIGNLIVFQMGYTWVLQCSKCLRKFDIVMKSYRRGREVKVT